jgi:hypothetical protein
VFKFVGFRVYSVTCRFSGCAMRPPAGRIIIMMKITYDQEKLRGPRAGRRAMQWPVGRRIGLP